MAKQPNILWIQTDEQRPDSLGCYGSKWAKTPHIDALAARGVVFGSAVCQSPVCVASRTSQMTCRYPQEVNALGNEVAQQAGVLPAGTKMFTQVLAEAGYETVTFGKRHLPAHDSWQRHESCVLDPEYAGYFALNERFDEAGHHVVKRPGGSPVILAGTYPTTATNPSKTITDWGIDYLKRHDGKRPFVLRVSHNWPHTPVLPPPPFDALYDPDDLPVRYYDEAAYRGRSAHDRRMADGHRMRDLSKQQYRQVWRDYMGLCAYVDYEVGRLLEALADAGLERETIVIYSSDHGKMLGEWGTGEKGVFDTPSWCVPFVWSWPGHLPEGQVRQDLCELVDQGKTLLNLAGLKAAAPANWRGRDLFEAADGGVSGPEAVFGQIGLPNSDAPLIRRIKEAGREGGIDGRPMQMAVRTKRYRMDLIWMAKGRRVEPTDGNLFDLQADPEERVNLWHDPACQSAREELLGRLEDWFAGMDKPAESFGD